MLIIISQSTCPEKKSDIDTEISSTNENVDNFFLETEESDSSDDDPYFREESHDEFIVKRDENDESGLKFYSETNQNVNNEFDLDEINKNFKGEMFFSKQDQISVATKKKSIFENQQEEYMFIRKNSFDANNFEYVKTRANSILRTLEAGCKIIRNDD